MQIKMIEALRRFFNTPGYPELTSKELLDFMRADKAGYHEVAKLCAEALGEELLPQQQQQTN